MKPDILDIVQQTERAYHASPEAVRHYYDALFEILQDTQAALLVVGVLRQFSESDLVRVVDAVQADPGYLSRVIMEARYGGTQR